MAEDEMTRDAADRHIARLTKMLQIIEEQVGDTHNPRVFGSYPSDAVLPGDVDVVLDARHEQNWMLNRQLQAILSLGRGGGYGLLDVFIEAPDGLFVRNDECTGYTKAKNARAFKVPIKYAVPIRQAIAMRQTVMATRQDTDEPSAPELRFH